MEEQDAINALFGKPGEPVPVVSVEDLKKARGLCEDVKARHPEGGVAIGMGIWEQVLPGADIKAVTYRNALLGILEMFLEETYPGGKLSDNALKVAAEIELKWMPVGVPQERMELNVELFLASVWGLSMSEKN